MPNPRTEADVAHFEDLVSEYADDQLLDVREAFPLMAIYRALHHHPMRGRVMASAEDLQLNYLFLLRAHRDFHGLDMRPASTKAALTTARYARVNDLRRINFVTEAIGFVLRYRALWDKLMGLIVLLVAPDRYEAFAKADSLKKEFLKIVGSELKLPQLNDTIESIQAFDDEYRTAEAHGSGRLRKAIYSDSLDVGKLHDEFSQYMYLAELWVASIADTLAPDREQPPSRPVYERDHAEIVNAFRTALSRTLRPSLRPVS